MKKPLYIITMILAIYACSHKTDKLQETQTNVVDSLEQTNNFYDNEPTENLPMVTLTVDGEVANPSSVNFSKLPIRSVIVKETMLNPDGSDKFIGAYRYDGYSLFDILNNFVIKKKNADEFPPIIDLYVEVGNDKGEKVVFSWGELYYPNNLNKIIIAKSVMRIVPSKTKELWPLPTESKLVVATDLLTERNISNPSKIIVRSLNASLVINRDIKPFYCEKVDVIDKDGNRHLLQIPANIQPETYNTIFYGRGRGIHSTTPFTGYLLKDVLLPYFPLSNESIKKGMFTVAALDGYRVAMTYSEIFNRNDQQEFLLINNVKGDGGKYKIFPAGDFFSDRAIKALKEIRFSIE